MKMSPYITMKKRMIKFLGGYTAQEYEELKALTNRAMEHSRKAHDLLDRALSQLEKAEAQLSATAPIKLFRVDGYEAIDLVAQLTAPPIPIMYPDLETEVRKDTEWKLTQKLLDKAKGYIALNWTTIEAGPEVLSGRLRVMKKVN